MSDVTDAERAMNAEANAEALLYMEGYIGVLQQREGFEPIPAVLGALELVAQILGQEANRQRPNDREACHEMVSDLAEQLVTRTLLWYDRVTTPQGNA
jgi:hypothetical protein